MTPEQLVALLQLLADLRHQIGQQAAEIVHLRQQLDAISREVTEEPT